MILKWYLRLRLHFAKRSLARVRTRRDALDLASPDYGGIYVDQMLEEGMLLERIEGIKQRLSVNGSAGND